MSQTPASRRIPEMTIAIAERFGRRSASFRVRRANQDCISRAASVRGISAQSETSAVRAATPIWRPRQPGQPRDPGEAESQGEAPLREVLEISTGETESIRKDQDDAHELRFRESGGTETSASEPIGIAGRE